CDVGSQGTNAVLVDADGTQVASAYRAYEVSFPRPAWAEQDAALWVEAVVATVGELARSVPSGAVHGLSFGSQLDGMVAVDAAGEPVRPALIWMDRRAERQAEAVASRVSREDFYGWVGAN